ncbi:MAG: hypothetical protein K5900_04220 [Butyrivibrio sp.]|nr:hypothetical protein [Butyrivibrio sp.]
MRGKSATALLSIVTISLVMLSGCGNSFPEMSQEEYDQTVQYAAGLLMRYSNNAVEKLIYVNPDKVELEDEEESTTTETDIAKAETEKTEPPQSETTTEKGTTESGGNTQPSGVSISGNAGSTDAAGDASNYSATETSKEDTDKAATDISIAEASVDTVQEDDPTASATTTTTESGSTSTDKVISYSDEQELMDGLYLRYNGYYVTSSYPENAKTMVIEAGNGKRLLVFSFRVVNESGQDKYLDMVKLNPYFQLTINGTNVGYTSVTMLENDLSTFAGTIAAGESKTLVLVKEIDTSLAKNIQELELTISMDGQSQTVIME